MVLAVSNDDKASKVRIARALAQINTLASLMHHLGGDIDALAALLIDCEAAGLVADQFTEPHAPATIWKVDKPAANMVKAGWPPSIIGGGAGLTITVNSMAPETAKSVARALANVGLNGAAIQYMLGCLMHGEREGVIVFDGHARLLAECLSKASLSPTTTADVLQWLLRRYKRALVEVCLVAGERSVDQV